MLAVPPLDALRYLHKADPLERRVTFDDLQTRPLGFQSAMPRDPIASMTNSFEFRVREGEMFEAAKSAATTMTAEKMREATAEHVASTEGLPRELAGLLVAPPAVDAAVAAHGGASGLHAAEFAAQQSDARLAEAMQLHRDHAAAQSSVSLHTPAVPHTPIAQVLSGVDQAGQYLPPPGGPLASAVSPRQWATAMQTWMSERAQRGVAPIPGMQSAQDLG